MRTATLVNQTADVVTISHLERGDVYKRLDDRPYMDERIVLGVVTDVLHNGTHAVVQATEFDVSGGDVEPKQKTFGPQSDLKLFPAAPEDIEAHYANIRKKAQDRVTEAERAVTQKRETLTHVDTVISDLVSLGLSAAKTVAYIESAEIDE